MNESEFRVALESLLRELGEDPDRAGMEKTPQRVWESVHYLTRGYRENLDELLVDATFQNPSKDLIMVRDIAFNSICEHHILPFYGTVHVGYRPDGRIIGLSKIARVVDHFACRLQVQERLTSQIADTLFDVLKPRTLAVTMSATHMCMAVRGVQKLDSRAVSSAWRGAPAEIEDFRAEYLSGISL